VNSALFSRHKQFGYSRRASGMMQMIKNIGKQGLIKGSKRCFFD